MLDDWPNVLGVLLQPCVTTLPLAVLMLIIGRRYAGWMKGEFLLSFTPWLLAMLFLILFRDERYFSYGGNVGFIGGLVLLPRLIFRTPHLRAKLFTTTFSTIFATAISLEWLMTLGPAFRY